MELKINEETIKNDREAVMDANFNRYTYLYNQALHYKKLYQEQLNSIDIRLNELNKFIIYLAITCAVTLVLGIFSNSMLLSSTTSLESFIFSFLCPTCLTVSVISGIMAIANIIKKGIHEEKNFFKNYISKKQITTMEAERLHCVKVITKIDALTNIKKTKDNISSEDIDALNSLTWYKEVRSSQLVLPLEGSISFSVFIITLIFLYFFLFF